MITRAVDFKADGITIRGGLYIPGSKGRYATVCVCHGIPSGKPPDPGDGGYPALAERLCREGLAAFIFNFRGTGKSGGNLDMRGWAEDLETAIDYLWRAPEVDKSRLSMLGFSGGAAVAVYVAARDRRVSYLALCACPAVFTLITRDGAQSVISHFRSIGVIRDAAFPPSAEEWLDGFKLVSPVDYIAGIAPRALLIVHGSDDKVVDVSHARRLYDRAGEPKQLIIIDGAGHRLRLDERAMAPVIQWLKSCCRG